MTFNNTPYYPGWTMPPTTPSRNQGMWGASPQQMYWPGASPVDPNQARREAWMAVQRGAEQAAKEAAEQEQKEKSEKEKKKQKEKEAMEAFWGSPAPTSKTSKPAPPTGDKSPGVVNVNIGNLEHGVFGQQPQPPRHRSPSPSTSSSSSSNSTEDATPFVPSMPCYTASPYPPMVTPFAMAPAVNWTSRPAYVPPAPSPPAPRSAASPWSSSKTRGPGKEVIDVASLVASHRTLDIRINPIIASRFENLALRADLREPMECVSVASVKDGENKLSEWKGHDEPLTLPRLNSVVLISTLFHEPMVVSNPSGVTVGDFLTQLLEWSHSPIPSATLSALPSSHQTYIEQSGHSLRAPYHPNSVVGPNISWIDLLFGKTVVRGLNRDSASTREVIGWDHPACFVVELGKPEANSNSNPMMGVTAAPMAMPMMTPMGMVMTPMAMMMPGMGMGGWGY
ncbi:hypothetical protein FRB94_014735 [Tulasnella sp. JGI-2019a]|nr:hypothetical protein FRB93_011539 [Tulasnella sp. JGI-2019a]KAG8989041.1 hypothetical protein FRB94_014735 [Tulasnella sp. JGI-2019a]